MMPSIADGRQPSRDLDEPAGSSRALREEHRVSRRTFVLFISDVVDSSETFVYCFDNASYQTVHHTVATCALCTIMRPQIKSIWR